MALESQLRPAFSSGNAQFRASWADFVASPPTISATNLEAIDLYDGTVYYTKGVYATNHTPASLVKLMTAYVLTRYRPTLASLAETTTITAADIADGTTYNLQAGDVISLHDLLINSQLPSDNSASSAIARVIGLELRGSGTEAESKARFVQEMNTWASSIGMTQTTYYDAHGLSGDSTPSDTNKLLRLLSTNEILLDIWQCSTRRITVTRSGSPVLLSVNASNDMAGEIGIVGGKTGTLSLANLSVLWEAPNGHLCAITLFGSPDDATRYVDMRAVVAALPIDYPALATPSQPFTPAHLFDTLGYGGGWWDGTGTADKWQDSAGTVAVSGSAQPVGKWAAKSGSGGVAFSQSTSSARPVYNGSGVVFDGSDDFLDFGSGGIGATGLFADAGDEFMIVAKFTASASPSTLIARAGTTTTSRTFHLFANSGTSDQPGVWVRGAKTSTTDGNLLTGTGKAVGVFWDGVHGGLGRVQLGAKDVLAGTAAEEVGQNILLGARSGGSGDFLTGSLQQIVIVDGYDRDAYRRLRDWANGATVNSTRYEEFGGQIATTSVGTLSASLSCALAGTASVTSAGILTVQPPGIVVDGQQTTAVTGALAASVTTTLSGVASTVTVGTLTAESHVEGAQTTTTVGSLTPSLTLGLSGVQGTSSSGYLDSGTEPFRENVYLKSSIGTSSARRSTYLVDGTPINTVFVGDVGTKILLDCDANVSLSSVRKIMGRKPSGTKVEWSAALEGTDSIQYTTQAGDLDEVGRWRLQAYVEMPAWKGSGEVATLVINRPL